MATSRKLKFDEDVMCLAADSRDDLIVAGYEGGHVKLWDLRCQSSAAVIIGRCKNVESQEHEDVSSLSFGNKRREEVHIAAGSRIYRLDLRKIEDAAWTNPCFTLNEDDINQLSLSDNDEMLAVADDTHHITVLDLKNSRLLTHLKKHKSIVYSVQFRPGKPRELISGGYDCFLVHWDVLKCRTLGSSDLADLSDANWELPKAFNPSYVLCCRFASLGGSKADIVTAGTDNGNLHCFHCDKNLLHYRTFRAHDLGVTQVTCSKTGQTIVTGSNDRKIKCWNATKLFTDNEADQHAPEAVRIIEHGEKINWLSFFQDTELIVCDTTANISLIPLKM